MEKSQIFKLFLCLISIVFAVSCDDDTVSVGSNVLPDMNKVTTSMVTYAVNSRSVKADSVLGNTNYCYLGSITDPESRATTTCSFLSQYFLLENTRLPAKERIVMRDGVPLCDTCQIRFNVATSYGDDLAPMRLTIHELDTSNVMEEGKIFYTDIEPADYINSASQPLATTTYTLSNLTQSSSTSTSKSLTVSLPPAYGAFILQKYYENPTFFKNSYYFLRHVMPGFYMEAAGGTGAMMGITASDLLVHFKYHDTTAAGKDTIYDGYLTMASTEEVIQNTRVDNVIPDAMLDASNDYTYVKSPAGIFTLVDIPVGDIVAGEHYADTINSARIIFPCMQGEVAGDFSFAPPSTLLLVRKGEMYSFFETSRTGNDRTSFISEYSSTYNGYVFSNIAPLVTIMKLERDKGAGVTATDTEAQRQAKYTAWEAANPDWATVALVPVKPEFLTGSSAAGTVTRTLLRVRNELDLASVRLLGGSHGKLAIDITYSRFD